MTDRKIRLLNLHGGKVNHEEKGKKKGKEAVQADRNCTSQAAGQGRAERKCREELGGNDRERSCRAESCSSTSQVKAICPTGGGRGGLDCTENSELCLPL